MDVLFGFSGRIGRLQWWLVQLVILVILALCVGIAFLITATDDLSRSAAASEGLDSRAAAIFLLIAAAAVLMTWVNIASTVKRFHDRNKSGYWFLITFVPYIGAIWVTVECGFLPGSPGTNQYGSPRRSGDRMAHADMGDDMAIEYSGPEQRTRAAPAAQLTPATPRRASHSGFGRRGLS